MEVVEVKIPEQKVFEDGLVFPLALSPLGEGTARDAANYVEANKSSINEKRL